jgi:hypothetical protein
LLSDRSTGFAELGKDQMDIKKKMNVRLGDDLSLRLIFEGFTVDNQMRKPRTTASRGTRNGSTTSATSRAPGKKSHRGSGKDVEQGVSMVVTKYDKVPLEDESKL